MGVKKLVTGDKLRSLITQLKDIFLTKQEGKKLEQICEYAIPMEYEGVLSVSLLGPDGHVYRLVLNEDFRLTLEEHIKPRTVKYLISGDDYYYLVEDENGIYITKYTGDEEIPAEEVGYVRATSRDTRMKFTLDVVDNNVVFNLHKGPALDEMEAKYMTCGNKICYFEIKNDQVEILYEYTTIETDDLPIK